jgi:hypothetical protein
MAFTKSVATANSAAPKPALLVVAATVDEFYGGLNQIGDSTNKKRVAVMKMQFLLAGIVAAGLFASVPGAVAHGGSGGGGGSRGGGGHGGGSWGGHGGGSWGGHGGGSGAAMVVAPGAATVAGFTTADVFSARVLASMATATRGGIRTIRAMPTILTRTTATRTTATRTTATRTTAIRTMAARTMAALTMAIRTTKTVILAHPLPRRSKRRSHGAGTIAVRLTVHLGRRLAMQFDHSRRIKACRLPARWTAG